MLRRSFLKAFGATAIGLVLVRTLPGVGGHSFEQAFAGGDYETFQPGDVFTIESRYVVNPETDAVDNRSEYSARFVNNG